jgi:multisite-specific tRNA:(cytosine-C5)-methyltransferase
LNALHILSGCQIQGTKIQHPLAKGIIVQPQKEHEPETRLYETILTRQQNNVSKVVDAAEVLGRQQNLSIDNQTSNDNSTEVEMVFNDVESSRAESGDMQLQKQSRWKGVDPVLFFKDEVVIKSIISFFGIKESFPLQGHLVTRSTDNARRIYYVSKSVKKILELNGEVGEQLKIVSLGIKMFVSIKCSKRMMFFTDSRFPSNTQLFFTGIHILLKP